MLQRTMACNYYLCIAALRVLHIVPASDSEAQISAGLESLASVSSPIHTISCVIFALDGQNVVDENDAF